MKTLAILLLCGVAIIKEAGTRSDIQAHCFKNGYKRRPCAIHRNA